MKGHGLIRHAAIAMALSVGVSVLVVSPPTAADEGPAAVVTVDDGLLSLWRHDTGAVRLTLPAPVFQADLDAEGDRLAVATGVPVMDRLGGVTGQVAALDVASDSGQVETLATTQFSGAIITHVAMSSDGSKIAFVKDYSELWWMRVPEVSTNQTVPVRMTDAETLAPGGGNLLFQPTFSADGLSVYVGAVEKNFAGGEDDKLDNIWQVTMGGQATKVTQLAEGPAEHDWLIVRDPIALEDGSIMYTTLESGTAEQVVNGYDPYTAEFLVDPPCRNTLTPGSSVCEAPDFSGRRLLAELPTMTTVVAAGPTQTFFLSYDRESAQFDLVAMNTSLISGWTGWCEPACETLASDIDVADVAI